MVPRIPNRLFAKYAALAKILCYTFYPSIVTGTNENI